jgi:hypothetical protein
MVRSVSISGQSTFILDDRVLKDFPNGDIATLTFPNNLTESNFGIGGNVLYSLNAKGAQCDVEFRLLSGSADDKVINSKLLAYSRDPVSFVLIKGQIVEKFGDGNGSVVRKIYSLEGGIFRQYVDTKLSSDGDTEQAISLYRLTFGSGTITIG